MSAGSLLVLTDFSLLLLHRLSSPPPHPPPFTLQKQLMGVFFTPKPALFPFLSFFFLFLSLSVSLLLSFYPSLSSLVSLSTPHFLSLSLSFSLIPPSPHSTPTPSFFIPRSQIISVGKYNLIPPLSDGGLMAIRFLEVSGAEPGRRSRRFRRERQSCVLPRTDGRQTCDPQEENNVCD